MPKRVWTLAVLVWFASAAWSVPLAAGPQASARPAVVSSTTSDYGTVVTKYCVTCHNERAKIGGLTLDKMDVTDPGAGPDVWEPARRQVRRGIIPPQGSPPPEH